VLGESRLWPHRQLWLRLSRKSKHFQICRADVARGHYVVGLPLRSLRQHVLTGENLDKAFPDAGYVRKCFDSLRPCAW
jgi:hypothetical protein